MYECMACHSDYTHTPDVRVFFSTLCDHRVCEPCIARLYDPGPYKCPSCHRMLSARDFSREPLEAREVDTEVKVRRQLAEIFCKTEEDFVSNDEYNDYLMEREDIVDRLVNSASQDEAQETWREIEKYRQQHAEQIQRIQRLAPKRKFQKILKIIEEEGSFFTTVNADGGDAATEHPLVARHQSLFSNPPPDRSRTPSPVGDRTPTRDTGLGSPAPLRRAEQHMSGGGYPRDACMQKARHFFFTDLVLATSARPTEV